MGFHLRDRGLGRRIAQHEKRLNELEAAFPQMVAAINSTAHVVQGLVVKDAAASTVPHDFDTAAAKQQADRAERAQIKAALTMVPPLA